MTLTTVPHGLDQKCHTFKQLLIYLMHGNYICKVNEAIHKIFQIHIYEGLRP